MSELIEPRLLKGFRDFLPRDERERQRIIATLARTFTSFGFEPIDTPVLEYTEILLGKGGGETDKQVYRFDDQGGRDVALRYDLTVPFARFMALHLHHLPVPFKRFHTAKVFRGENTQRGRYREFVQCDFDIVGSDSVSADFEILLLMARSFESIGVRDVKIHIAHRSVFNALVTELGIPDRGDEVMRTVDKLRKVGEQQTRDTLESIAGESGADTILAFIRPGPDNAETLRAMADICPGAASEIARLRAVLDMAKDVGFENRLVVDPSITRGLDYYTGMVFETFLEKLPAIGSICSGGRYDNLAGLYTRDRLPGVGASIGLDRLMAALEELGAGTMRTGAADALVLATIPGRTGACHLVADRLRREGLRVEVYPDERKPVHQFSLAEKKGIPAAIMVGDDWREDAAGLTVRDLGTRTNTSGLTLADAARVIREIAGTLVDPE